ncbi:MAG: type II CAAX endopeptidase family protein [Candidatus Acidiferrum sp.]
MPATPIVAPPRALETSGSLAGDIAAYIWLTFGISWVLLIGAIKLGLGEEYLNIGIAGPAIAALLLSGRHHQNREPFSAARLLWFSGAWVLCWILIYLHYLWPSSGALEFRLHPLLLIPAALPAWILSGIASGNEGVRSLIRRILYTPTRWSLFAFLCLPIMLGVPSVLAHMAGAQLVWPDHRASAVAEVASGIVFFLFNLLFVGTEEEPGWRGFLLDRLQRKFSPLSASLCVWFPWAVWHAPLDYFRPVRFGWVTYLLLRVVFMIPFTIILTWLYNRSHRSIQATVIFHASMNTVPFVIPYYQPAWFLLFVFTGYAVISGKM